MGIKKRPGLFPGLLHVFPDQVLQVFLDVWLGFQPVDQFLVRGPVQLQAEESAVLLVGCVVSHVFNPLRIQFIMDVKVNPEHRDALHRIQPGVGLPS